MEDERRINWLSLFIKIVIIFIFALIIIWLVSKIINKNKLSETFNNNINNMEKVSIEYFKGIDLPLDKGKSIKITLEELIEKELIVSINNDGKNICDTKNSYSKITREKKNYIVETKLICGKEKNTITKKFDLKDCRNCNNSIEKDNSEQKETNTKSQNKYSNAGTSNNSSSNNEKDTYYEYVKEWTTYTKWMRGSTTGTNIENKYEYYGIDQKTYYTIGFIKKDDINKSSITYTLKLDNVPNSKYYFTTVDEVSYFNSNDESEYLNEKNVSLYNNKNIKIPNEISSYSLKYNNFAYKLSPYYRQGSFYVNVTIYITDINNVKTYYDSNIKENIYLIPLKLNIKFASNEITSTKPSGDYETISYYRYVETNRDVIWSTEDYVEGYTKTGNTKVQ